jgi:nucleoside-diphosphate-sugar epimerase
MGETLLVTGATGAVGKRVVRRALDAGYRVRAMVRDAGRTDPELAGWGAELVEGDMAAPESLPAAAAGADVVVHTAAHIGDWGPADLYRAVNVVGLEHLLTAVERENRLRCFVHCSSVSVYPPHDHFGTDETVPPNPRGMDGYTTTKAESEILVRDHMARCGLPAVIFRPGSMYGPGDRHFLPKLIERFKAGKMKIIGSGKAVLANLYFDNFVDAIFLALQRPQVVGETFNVRDERLVSRLEYFNTVADYLGVPRARHFPLGVAKAVVPLFEGIAKLRGRRTAPLLTRGRIKFMSLNQDYSIDKAKRLLGYRPQVDFQDGIRAALDWAAGKTPVSATV